jgi:MFS family permease
MSIGSLRIPSLGEFREDTRLILIASGIFSVGFFGIQTLLKVLYILRLGYGLEYVGLFTATPALTFMAMSLPSGAIGNRIGLKPAMVMGGVFTTAGMLLLPLAEAVPPWAADAWPIFTQMALTTGWAMFSINMVPALMAATTTRTRDDAYALSSMLRGLGTFFGTVVGGLLPMMFAVLLGQSLDGPAPYRWALLVGALFGVVGLVPLLRVRNVELEPVDAETERHGNFPTLLVAIVVLHVFLIHGGIATCQSFCSAYMDTDLHLSAAAIGLLTGIGQFAAVLAPVMMPVLAARRSNAWTMMMAAVGTAVFMLPLALIPNWFAAGIGRLGVLALAAIWMPALQVFQMGAVDRHWRSLAYGTVSTGMGFSFGAISLVGGFIAASWGYSSLFMMGAVMAAMGAAVMWALQTIPALRSLAKSGHGREPAAARVRSGSVGR